MRKRSLAKQMRRNLTSNEAKLWELLRGRQLDGLKFRRQAPIGRYVADFVCYQRRLIVEADGPQHEDDATHDLERDAWLRDQGFLVLRIPNEMIATNKDAVLGAIRRTADSRAFSNVGDAGFQGQPDDGASGPIR